MKTWFIFFLLLSSVTRAQEVPVLQPKAVFIVDFPDYLFKNFNTEKSFENCEKVYKKMQSKNYKLTPEDSVALLLCSETKESPWEIIGQECSWYCLGGGDSITASSQLASQGKNNYSPDNAHDLSYKTAWVEGAAGNGVGEYLVYHFKTESNRIDQIIVVNGYVKSQQAWEDNARIKRLKVYKNDLPIAILELDDKRAEQTFDVKQISFQDRKGSLKFEIMEVYPGKKYEDAVITEIYFDGPSH